MPIQSVISAVGVRSKVYRGTFIGLLGLSLLASSGCARQSGLAASAEPTNKPAPAQILPHPALAAANGASISDIAERVLPSVVNISLTKVSRTEARRSPLDDPFFRHFF